jgi:hypothetical protein
MQKARKNERNPNPVPGRVLGRVLAEDLRNVSAGVGRTAVLYRDENGGAHITNLDGDNDG